MNKNNILRGRWLPLVGMLCGLLAGCGTDQEPGCRPDPAADAPAVALRLQRLEQPFFRIQNPAEALQFMQAHPAFARLYLQRTPENDAAMSGALAQLAINKDLRKLRQEAAAAFPDSAALAREMGELLRRVHYYFPDFKVPQANTYVSGLLGKDIFVNDTLLVLSLDWFAGPKASYRPELPQYMLRRYTPAHLLPSLALNVASKYNKHELTANKMLDAMVHNGKALYFASQVLPCTSDTLLLGFTGTEMVGLEANEAKVWGHFLEKKLLYTSTPFLVQKYVGERPNVPEIDKNCPGRVGQWVGLQIVRKYMAEHPEVTLPQLMSKKDAQQLLNESHYRPQW